MRILKPKIAKPRVADNKKVRNVLRRLKKSVRASPLPVARKNSITHSTVLQILKKNNVIDKQRVKIPKYMPTQLQKIPRCCQFLLLKHFCDQKVIVLDDEQYFTFSHSTMTGMNGFCTDDVGNTPDIIKYKAVGKFQPKVLLWCAISEAGVSKHFIWTVKGEAVNAEVYIITKCLPKMVKFIQKHHKND
jgi:hypothetical protein